MDSVLVVGYCVSPFFLVTVIQFHFEGLSSEKVKVKNPISLHSTSPLWIDSQFDRWSAGGCLDSMNSLRGQPLRMFENTREKNQIGGRSNSFQRQPLRKTHSEPLQPIVGVSSQRFRQDSITSMVKSLAKKKKTFTHNSGFAGLPWQHFLVQQHQF